MKNFNFKQVLKFLPLSLMLLMMLYSCLKEEDFGSTEVPPALTAEQLKIQAAKAWFEQHLASIGQATDSIPMYILKSGNGNGNNGNGNGNGNGNNGNGPKPKAKPKWEQARVGVDNVVEVPLESLGKISYASSENATDEQLASAVTQMIIVNRNGEYVAALMHIVADAGYLETKGYDLSQNYYKDLADDFSGRVFYTFLDGEYCNGWRYDNGKITATLSYNGSISVPDLEDTSVQPSAAPQICTEWIDYIYVQWCTTATTQGETTDLGCGEWKLFYSYTYWKCEDIYDDDDGGFVPPGGGGTPPTYYTVTLTANPAEGGTVSGGGSFQSGATVTITATAATATGYSFSGWQGDVSSTKNTHSFVVTGNCEITALFLQLDYTPCDQRDSLQQNTTIANEVNILKTEAASFNWEVARYETKGPNGVKPWIVDGPAGQGNVDFFIDPGDKYYWMFHSHYELFKDHVPSEGDIYTLYQLFSNNYIDKFSNFVYGIVNKSGVAYGITISNFAQFNAFAFINGLGDENSPWYKDLERELKKAGANAQLAEKRFADALFGSGLSIMKQTNNPVPYINGWQQIEYNPVTETVVVKPCN